MGAIDRAASSLAIGIAMLGATPAFAGQEGGEAGSAAQPAEEGGLQEIVVTAQRRAESVQNAALAVTAISSDELTRRSVTDPSQLSMIAPALQINNTFGPTNNFYLRGVGNFVTNVNSDAAVIVNLDSVPIGRATGVNGQFFDLERIEVLKGPQGTLYGRNATGGAINLITRKPEIGALSGYANASYGNLNAMILNAAANVPVGESVAVRVAGQWSKRDGYYSDGTGDENIKSVRATLRAEISPAFTLTISGDYTHMGGIGAGASVYGLKREDRIGLLDPRAGAIYASTLSFPAGAFLHPMTTPNYQDNDIWGVYAQADIDTGIGMLSIIPAYRGAKLRYVNSAAGFDSVADEDDKQISLEARLVSTGDSPLQYVIGAFYMHENNRLRSNFNHQYFAAYSNNNPISKAYAAYGQLTYSITPELRLTGGIRYTHDRRSNSIFSVSPLIVCTTLPTPCLGTAALPVQLDPPAEYRNPAGGYFTSFPNGNGAIASISSKQFDAALTFQKTTWRAGIEYDVGPRSLLYATYETGFKAGGFYASSRPDPSFRPEEIKAFTIGSKNRFMDNKLQLNIEGFWWTYKDQQFSHFITNQDGSVDFGTENIGKARVRGIELEAIARVARRTTLNLTVQYLDANLLDFSYNEPSAGRPAPTTGCAVSAPAGAPPVYTVNCSGRRPANAPEWTLNAGIEHVVPLRNGGDITLNAQTRFQSDVTTGTEYLDSQIQASYFKSDLTVTYNSPGDRYFISAYVNNLENNVVVGHSQIHPRAPQLLKESLNLPRTYGVRAGVKF